MNNHVDCAPLLAPLLERHLDEIAADWSEQIYQNASFHPGEGWLETLLTSTTRGLKAIVEVLRTGSDADLNAYLGDLCRGCLRSGFESGEVSEALLLCKDAVMPVISRVTDFPSDAVWAAVSDLDICLRLMIGYFNTLYAAEVNRRLVQQHEHIMAMLKLGEQPPETLEIDEVLRYVAQGIIDSIEVDHCDFYLVSDDQQHLIPRLGLSKSSLPTYRVEAFLNHPPDKTSDVFLRQVMERKEPLISDNVALDSRVNRAVAEPMKSKSVLAVPLVSHQQVFAIAVTGTFADVRAFTAEQLEMARDIARTATLVIENTRLHQQTRYVAALEERERLAREIHDDLAQVLSVLNLQTSYVQELLANGQVEQAQTFLAGMKNMAAEAHADSREAIFSLRHGVATTEEFLPMLQAHVDRYRNLYGIDVHLDIEESAIAELSASAVNQLPRIIQEALTNVRKHSSATLAWVRMENHGAFLTVTIEDNGQGFEPGKVQHSDGGGVGLQVMRERAESLGGSLEIQTQAGQGTQIIARIPLSNRK